MARRRRIPGKSWSNGSWSTRNTSNWPKFCGNSNPGEAGVYTRPPADLSAYAPEENPVGNLTPDDLFQAFVEVLSSRRKQPPVTRIVREEISVGDRMEELLRLLSENGGTVRFSRLLHQRATREQIVTTFLALLELMKMKRVVCRQEQLFGEIIIIAVGEKGEGLH